jgi:hypothetical protein
VAGPPQREPDSVPSAGRSAAQPMGPGEDSGDVLEAGSPRRRLSRKAVAGIEVVCGIAAFVLVGVTVWGYIDDPVHTTSPTVSVDGDPVPFYRPGGVDFAVTLTNHSDSPIVIDNVSVLNEDYAENGVAPEWVAARVYLPSMPGVSAVNAFNAKPKSVEVEGNGGAAVLEVRADPPCGRSPQPQLAQIVVGWHGASGELEQIIVPDLLNAGTTSFDDLVHKVCHARKDVSVEFGP